MKQRRSQSGRESEAPAHVVQGGHGNGSIEEIERLNREIDDLHSELSSRAPTEPAQRMEAANVLIARARRVVTNGITPLAELDSDPLLAATEHLVSALCRVDARILLEAGELPYTKDATKLDVHQKLVEAREYIEQHFAQPLTLAAMAEVATISRHHFLRLFQAAFGATPYQYLLRVRIDTARRLLLDTDLPVQDIARMTGFDDHVNFTQRFRKLIGIPPSHFRMKARPEIQL